MSVPALDHASCLAGGQEKGTLRPSTLGSLWGHTSVLYSDTGDQKQVLVAQSQVIIPVLITCASLEAHLASLKCKSVEIS